jgi:hypothetical protein
LDLVKILFAGFVVWLVYAKNAPGPSVAGRGVPPIAAVVPIRALPPRTVAAESSFDVRGKPTISVALINQVLTDFGSPLAGQGQALYDLGLKYGIDPAFCLAFFVHESAAGTRGEATLTHSVGNFRATAGAPSMDGYRYYDSWLEGAEDWYRQISHQYIGRRSLTTVDRIISVYVSTGDLNDMASYIDDVEQLVSAWRAQSS